MVKCAPTVTEGRVLLVDTMPWIVLLVAAFAFLSLAQLYQMSNVPGVQPRMTAGRLIRVQSHRSNTEANIYVVAEPEFEKAVDILKIAFARPDDEYEDLGRVADALLNALGLQLGQFART
jgi:hypothetical protein